MQPIVLLSGPVGAGKSTVARELIANSTGATAYIEGDTFWSFIARGGEAQKRHKNFRVIMAAMTAAAVPYAVAGYEVILDFSIPPFFLETARKIAKSKEVPLDYVVLCPSETICAARAAARREGTIADYAAYREFYATFEGVEHYTIRDDRSDAASLAASIRDGLRSGRFRLPQ
jgi:adenylate kinase family enzyme